MSESENISVDEARYLPIRARTDELNLLESYLDDNEGYIDDTAVRRHIIARRAAIVALATLPEDAEVFEFPEQRVHGRTLSQWHKFLSGDSLQVSSTRYGKNAAEIAWWAIAYLVLLDDSDLDLGDIDEYASYAMSLVASDDDSTALYVLANSGRLPLEVLKHLDWSVLEQLEDEAEPVSAALTPELAAEAVVAARKDEIDRMTAAVMQRTESWDDRVEARWLYYYLTVREQQVIALAERSEEDDD